MIETLCDSVTRSKQLSNLFPSYIRYICSTPYFVVYWFRDRNENGEQTEAIRKMNQPIFHKAQTLTLTVGFALAGFLEIRSVFSMLHLCLGKYRCFGWLKTASISSNTVAESRIKFASLFKVKNPFSSFYVLSDIKNST
jgi:hypothetical protein